ncbi:MAG: hypothetical protein QNJ46_13905 [Leptolyngbyaceae cyanobacterium MO_188.B28]|nr:hypothetical protein [Leptolyngbyaceae cyanobacterium MO_188.B28]
MHTSREWLAYYKENGESLLNIPWGVGGELTEKERSAIAASVQAFQISERSEGIEGTEISLILKTDYF